MIESVFILLAYSLVIAVNAMAVRSNWKGFTKLTGPQQALVIANVWMVVFFSLFSLAKVIEIGVTHVS